MEIVTQEMLKMIFMVPNSFLNLSVIAFTKASPEFIMTLALTVIAIPKARTMVLAKTQHRQKALDEHSIWDMSQNQ